MDATDAATSGVDAAGKAAGWIDRYGVGKFLIGVLVVLVFLGIGGVGWMASAYRAESMARDDQRRSDHKEDIANLIKTFEKRAGDDREDAKQRQHESREDFKELRSELRQANQTHREGNKLNAAALEVLRKQLDEMRATGTGKGTQ